MTQGVSFEAVYEKCQIWNLLLCVSILIILSVECRESKRDILRSSQRPLHLKTVSNKHQMVLYCGLVDCAILINDIR